jgi:hypothetical protein
MFNVFLAAVILTMSVCSCSAIKKSPKTEFADGFYVQKTDIKKEIVYIHIEGDSLRVHPSKKYDNKRIIDTTGICRSYPKEMTDRLAEQTSFGKHSFDIDFLTIPLKYRPSKKGVPPQLNTNLNGAAYFGFRTDKFHVTYEPNALNKSVRGINHYGFSFGLFTGIGNTAMSPTTTNGGIATEYDGIVWSKGVAGIAAINNFTVGLSVGFDNILDNNKKYWVYETKPWLGLAFGLNLN